ncbi:MAG: protein-glutamate methylesterase/protein-glutamine glutaminase [Terriglobales bacterium]
MSNKVRVLVVDDSALMRKLIPQILQRDGSIEVVGTAMDGDFGLRKVEDLRPDVITVDLDMPRVDGMEMLRQIARKSRIPVIVVSAHSTAGASATFKALALGAFDFVAKPRSVMHADLEEIAKDLVAKVKVAAQAGPIRPEPAFPEFNQRVKKPVPAKRQRAKKIVAIGISTGGPNALQYVLSQLPATLSAAIVVVQHMPEGFTELFARRLDDCCAVEVKEAQSGDLLYAGRVLIAPGNRHLKVRRTALGDVATLTDDPRCNGHRPSADILFRSVAQEFGADSLGLIMTGMGEDGADALNEIKIAGGITIAQDEKSCVVFGMPKAAIERGTAMRVLPLDAISNSLIALCGQEQFQPAENLPATAIEKLGD